MLSNECETRQPTKFGDDLTSLEFCNFSMVYLKHINKMHD